MFRSTTNGERTGIPPLAMFSGVRLLMMCDIEVDGPRREGELENEAARVFCNDAWPCRGRVVSPARLRGTRPAHSLSSSRWMGHDEKENWKMKRREFFATTLGLAGAGLFPRLVYAELDPPIRLAHLGAHEGRFTTGGLTLVSGYSVEGHHQVGQAVVELISRYVSGAKRSVLTVVASSADALRLLRAGRTDTAYGQFTVDLVLVEGDEAYAALQGGNASGSQDSGELRLLTMLPPQFLHIVTLRERPIGSIGELKGKKVSVGPPRSRSEKVMLRLLEALDPSVGISLQREPLGLSESMWALGEKKIDALAWHGPISPLLFEHLAGLLKIRIALLSYEEGVP